MNLLRLRHDWHTANMKSGSWKRKLRDELERVTLGMHLAKPKTGMAGHILCIVTKTRCNNIQTEINTANISEKK